MRKDGICEFLIDAYVGVTDFLETLCTIFRIVVVIKKSLNECLLIDCQIASIF